MGVGIALQKTLAFLLLIGIGITLKKKIRSKEQLQGIKVIILSIALPATIFIALLKIEVKPSLIILPILALAINFLLWYGAKFIVRATGMELDSPKCRTALFLIPSFAPGLSCFPFVLEFLGEESLALAAFADVGNKIFVLIILYIIAMQWFFSFVAKHQPESFQKNDRLKSLLGALIREPINMVMVVAIVMLFLGMNLQSLPHFLQDTINRMSVLMTPLILLFIGLAVKLKRGDVSLMIQLLLWRSGLAFLISGVLVTFIPSSLPVYVVLLAVIFPQSACSFWPFAHMTAIESMKSETMNFRTFDLDFALNILAFSLPFSTLIILIICSSGEFFTDVFTLFSFGVSFIAVACFIYLFKAKSSVEPHVFQRTGEIERKKSMSEKRSVPIQ